MELTVSNPTFLNNFTQFLYINPARAFVLSGAKKHLKLIKTSVQKKDDLYNNPKFVLFFFEVNYKTVDLSNHF